MTFEMKRQDIPARPDMPFDLWTVVKQFASKEITRISIPVNFCEPISFLQRLTEDFEYAYALEKAATMTDSGEQMAHVAAFSASVYASTSERMAKPFNPLLNETFDFDRTDDLGWRAIAEQVSHHPPRSALYVEGKGWKCWEDYGIVMKYRGNYMQIKPEGVSHLLFESGNHYTWNKVITRINNVIIGTMWIDQNGTDEIINHKNGYKCTLTYAVSNAKESKKKVTGTVVNAAGAKLWSVAGEWDKGMMVAPASEVKDPDSMIEDENTTATLVWEKSPPRRNSHLQYNFGQFAIELNEPEAGVAPTDSRFRPDVRIFENGNWQEANTAKVTLEEKQRARLRDKENEPDPLWFKREKIENIGDETYVYLGGYWECKKENDWGRCPKIY
ncbi:oxysterol-binding protein 2 [Halyomorpha halys]|uniref:oxysterol-binding protein 2 n=1 Tax=Halyomorpha halys TaxID=286706 RepID=UPI0006D4F3E0|nr:oxysterol-binding protein 2 [Halyomorpha halys]